MSSICRAGLLVILIVALAGSVATADPPKTVADRRPRADLLDALLAAYKLYELPFPPADAAVVRWPRSVRIDNAGPGTTLFTLAFLIKPTKAGEPCRVFESLGHLSDVAEIPRPIEPRPEALKDFDDDVGPELAVHLHARGWSDLAHLVLDRTFTNFRPLPEIDLARSAWHYWLVEFRKPATDRKKVARLLKVISDRRADPDAPDDIRILDGLEQSLKPGKGKPGTTEALIDDLIEVTHTPQTLFGLLDEPPGPHPAYMKLVRAGFDAVPALLDHLDDDRLTRAYKPGDAGFQPYPYMVADVVSDLLETIAGYDESRAWGRQHGDRLDRATVAAWWAEAQKVGEEAYLVGHVLEQHNEYWMANPLLIDVLARKYPKRIPEVYRRAMKEWPELNNPELADAVASSTLPAETKRALFFEGARSEGIDLRFDAIDRLRALDPPAAIKLLVADLDGVRDLPDSSIDRPSLVYRLTSSVLSTNDPVAWAALEKTTRRVAPECRIDFVHYVAMNVLADQPEAARKVSLAFLAKFLTDEGVRDRVAEDLARVLNLGVEPKPEWTDADWAKLREDVRKALGKSGIR